MKKTLYSRSMVKMMKSIQKQLLLAILGVLCLSCGCGNSPTSADIADDTVQNAVLPESETASPQQEAVQMQGKDKETPDEEPQEEAEETESIWDEKPWEKIGWQDAAAVVELSPEEIAFDYQSFHFLSGMSVDEVQKATNRELEFLEYWGDSMIYTDSEDIQYYFLTDQDTFYGIECEAPDANAALSLAQNLYEEMYALYGEDYVYQAQWKIHEIESVEEMNKNKYKESYSETWPVLYSSRMEDKVKDSLLTDKVRLSLCIHTPEYQEQGYYSVGITQSSVPLDAMDAK